jgi:hypothetical protein
MVKNKWQLVKDFVNANEIIDKKIMRSTLNIKDSSNYTEGQYINHMLNAGFVRRISRGKYERLVKIPEKMSSSTIYRLSYDLEFTKKYMIALLRKQKLNNINERS